MGVPEIIRFAPGAGDALFFRRQRRADIAQRGVGGAHGRAFLDQPAESVDEVAVHGGIDEGAVVVLAVDLDEFGRDAAQRLQAHRLVVDIGAGAPVRHLHAAQDEVAVGLDLERLGREDRRMVAGQVEDGGDLPLLFLFAHEAAIAARAERQREGI